MGKSTDSEMAVTPAVATNGKMEEVNPIFSAATAGDDYDDVDGEVDVETDDDDVVLGTAAAAAVAASPKVRNHPNKSLIKRLYGYHAMLTGIS